MHFLPLIDAVMTPAASEKLAGGEAERNHRVLRSEGRALRQEREKDSNSTSITISIAPRIAPTRVAASRHTPLGTWYRDDDPPVPGRKRALAPAAKRSP